MFDDERARTYDQSARQSLTGYEALHEMARDCVATHDIHKMLLLGVGTGYEAEQLRARFPALQLVGVDPSDAMLAMARGRLDESVKLRLGVLDDFPDLVDLDAVLSVGVVHHLPDEAAQETLLRSLGRRIRAGGLLLIGCHVGPYAEDSLRARAMAARAMAHGTSAGQAAQQFQQRRVHTVPPSWDQLCRWFEESGFSSPEVLFTTGYFSLFGGVRS